MKSLVAAALLIASIATIAADTLPLTTREIALMLRSGYSNDAVIREVQKRHYGDLLEESEEKQLVKAGANARLIETIRSGSYQASESELVAAESKLAAAEQQQVEARARINQADDADKNETSNAVSQSRPADPHANAVYRSLKDSLVYFPQGSITPFDDSELAGKKYYLFFFSANWSPPGRKFTPQLAEYYNRVKALHPEFEVVFFSADRSQFGMETYVRDTKMPWPVVDFQKLEEKTAGMDTNIIKQIPCLLLVDSSGNVLSQTGGDDGAKSPDKVLADLDAILAGQKIPSVTRSK